MNLLKFATTYLKFENVKCINGKIKMIDRIHRFVNNRRKNLSCQRYTVSLRMFKKALRVVSINIRIFTSNVLFYFVCHTNDTGICLQLHLYRMYTTKSRA